jgi:predicted nucleotidyltransferase
VAIASWEEYERLKQSLTATGQFTLGANAHQLKFGADEGPYSLDLVPFDGVEHNGEIAWPPSGEFVMNVRGYADALCSALDVEIEPGSGQDRVAAGHGDPQSAGLKRPSRA